MKTLSKNISPTKNSSFSRKPLAVLLSAVLLASSTSFAMAGPEAVSGEDSAIEAVMVNEGWDSENLEKLSTHIGREVVHHLIAAHKAILKGDSGKARGNLVAAQRLNYSLLQIMPFVSVGEDVFNAKGKLALGETEVFYDELLPIYSELDEMSIYAPEPAKKAQGHLKKAEKLARKGDSKAAMSSIKDVMDAISESTLYLPVMTVEGQLKAALYSLNQPKRDVKTAETAIQNAMKSLKAYTDEVLETPVS